MLNEGIVTKTASHSQSGWRAIILNRSSSRITTSAAGPIM